MNYKEMVQIWDETEKKRFNFRFLVCDEFSKIYHYIAQQLNIDVKNKLNNYMKVYPINEKSDKVIESSLYSLPGSVEYQSSGWCSVGLIFKLNEQLSTSLNVEQGEYRFSFFLHSVDDAWHLKIDDDNFENDKKFLNTEEDYLQKIYSEFKEKLISKISWDKKYKEDIASKVNTFFALFKNRLGDCPAENVFIQPSVLKNGNQLPINNFNITDCLQYETEDYASFCFVIKLEKGSSIFPKAYYSFRYLIKKNANKIELSVSYKDKKKNKYYPMDSLTEESLKDLFEENDDLLKNYFNFDNWVAGN